MDINSPKARQHNEIPNGMLKQYQIRVYEGNDLPEQSHLNYLQLNSSLEPQYNA